MFTSYIDLLYPTEDRNDRLRDSYFFTCECRECTTKDKVSSLTGRAEGCTQVPGPCWEPTPPPHIYNSHSAKKVKLPEEWHLKLTSGLHVGSHAQAGSGFLNLRLGPTQPSL